ncbi:MAG: antibiotic biosynthesis monooxygenase family protein [Acidimicrobiia bacterium]
MSLLRVPEVGAETLELAFRDRLGLVERHDGFARLEVWRDSREPGVYRMISWWRDNESFVTYMRSDAHRLSHQRIPEVPARPVAAGVTKHIVIAT